MPTPVTIEFDTFSLEGELFDNEIGKKLKDTLPVSCDLTYWGAEAYGSIGVDLGEASPQPRIPPGGIAYTRQGHYLCLFFGQDPAWPVEYVGKILSNNWEKLADKPSGKLTVRLS